MNFSESLKKRKKWKKKKRERGREREKCKEWIKRGKNLRSDNYQIR